MTRCPLPVLRLCGYKGFALNVTATVSIFKASNLKEDIFLPKSFGLFRSQLVTLLLVLQDHTFNDKNEENTLSVLTYMQECGHG